MIFKCLRAYSKYFENEPPARNMIQANLMDRVLVEIDAITPIKKMKEKNVPYSTWTLKRSISSAISLVLFKNSLTALSTSLD